MDTKKPINFTFGQLLGLILLIIVISCTIGYFFVREQLIDNAVIARASKQLSELFKEASTVDPSAIDVGESGVAMPIEEDKLDSLEFSVE